MTDDPIVAEVRAQREKLAAECGDDLTQIIQRARQRQAASGRRVVTFESGAPAALPQVVEPAGASDHGALSNP